MSSSTKLKCYELDDAKAPSSWDFLAYKLLNYYLDLQCQQNDCGGRNDGGLDEIEVEIDQMLCELVVLQLMGE